MTRINCIPVSELTDKHLLAEYRELPRISGLIWKWYNKTYCPNLGAFASPMRPRNYVLGEGHVKFFYDKGEFLRCRFEEEIVPEMQRRGFKTNFTKYRAHPDGFNRNWTPTMGDMELNRQRIHERLGGK